MTEISYGWCFRCGKPFYYKAMVHVIAGRKYCSSCAPIISWQSETENNVGEFKMEVKDTNPKDVQSIRKFDTGATRDIAEGKLDYTRALCPLVLKRYVQYLDKHRKQPDGSMRDFDNWKKGLPFRESFSSLGRHHEDLHLMIDGFPAEDNHGPCNIEDTLCAIIFNASTMLRERIKPEVDRTKPVDGDY